MSLNLLSAITCPVLIEMQFLFKAVKGLFYFLPIKKYIYIFICELAH